MEIPSLGRRVIAVLIDWVIASLSAVAVAGVDYPPKDITQNLIITAFYIAEVAILTGLLGQSIGKRLLGMRVENPAGRPIGIPRAVLRTALLTLVIPAIILTADKRGLHDLAAGSRVVRT